MPLTSRELLLFKEESTYRTDAVPTPGADAVDMREWTPNPSEGLRMLERPAAKGTFGRLQPVYAGSLFGLAFSVELKGSGTAGTAPRGLGALLECAALTPTVVASTSVTYAPTSVDANIKSGTAYYYADGVRHVLTGCRCRVTFAFSVENGLMANFELVGHRAVNGTTDAAVPSPTFDSTPGLPFIGASVSIGGYAAVINELTVDVGNNLITPPDPNQENGYGQIRVTNRAPTAQIDPEMTLAATNDWLTDWSAGNAQALATGVIGTVAGNRVAFSAPRAIYTGPGFADREELRTLTMPVELIETSGDDQFSLAFT